MTSPLSRDELAEFHASRAASVVSEAAALSHADRWGARLLAAGLDSDGLPFPGDDIPLMGAGQDGPPRGLPATGDGPPEPDWESLGVVAPAVMPDGVPEVDIMEFIAQGDDDDAEEWLVQGLVPKHGLTILGGNPKTGKTLFALDLGLAVASGREFFGRETAQAAFLFVTEEGSPSEMRKRMRRLVGSGGAPTLPAASSTGAASVSTTQRRGSSSGVPLLDWRSRPCWSSILSGTCSSAMRTTRPPSLPSPGRSTRSWRISPKSP
jgi:hypothetical protein